MQDSTHPGPRLPTRRKKPGPLQPGDDRHGTYNGYNTYGCRCDACRNAVQIEHQPRADKARELIAAAKNQPCADCGGTFPLVCMDFDHRDPALKSFTIAQGLQRSHEALLAEIAKCDVVCSNCHRLRTAAQHAAGVIKSGRPRKGTSQPQPKVPAPRRPSHGCQQDALWT
jgi:hypothetical protein